MKLYAYQKTHVKRLVNILEARRGAFDLSATGTGKTVAALSVCQKLGVNAAVVCPLAVIPGWKRTAEALSVSLQIVNYESLTGKNGWAHGLPFSGREKTLVIYDEAHRCKNWKTKNAKNMLRIAAAGYKILGLSATIAHNAEHLRAWNEVFSFTNSYSFTGFMNACGYFYRKTQWGGEWVPRDYALKATKRALEPFSSAMTLSDAAEMFKGNNVTVEVISSKDDKALSKTYADTFKTLRGKDKGENHLTRMLRARQASEAAKIPYVLESIEEIVEEGKSVVVFCNFDSTINVLAGELRDYAPAVVRGGQSPRMRENNRLEFQENDTYVMLCNIQAGGVGLDLHDVNGRPRYSLIMPSWSAVDLKQALGRIHRAGSKSPAVQKILYSDVDVERRIADVVREKLQALDTLHDSEINFEKVKK